MSKFSREKGKRGEREVAAILRDHGFNARRGQQYSGTETTADVVGLPGYHLEVKRTERLDLYGAYHQAERDAGDSGDVPVVVHRRNGQPWLAALPLDDFLRLLEVLEHDYHRPIRDQPRGAPLD